MDKVTHKTLITGETLSTEIVVDGDSDPMLEVRFRPNHFACLFSKEQLNLLVEDLQRKLATL